MGPKRNKKRKESNLQEVEEVSSKKAKVDLQDKSKKAKVENVDTPQNKRRRSEKISNDKEGDGFEQQGKVDQTPRRSGRKIICPERAVEGLDYLKKKTTWRNIIGQIKTEEIESPKHNKEKTVTSLSNQTQQIVDLKPIKKEPVIEPDTMLVISPRGRRGRGQTPKTNDASIVETSSPTGKKETSIADRASNHETVSPKKKRVTAKTIIPSNTETSLPKGKVASSTMDALNIKTSSPKEKKNTYKEKKDASFSDSKKKKELPVLVSKTPKNKISTRQEAVDMLQSVQETIITVTDKRDDKGERQEAEIETPLAEIETPLAEIDSPFAEIDTPLVMLNRKVSQGFGCSHCTADFGNYCHLYLHLESHHRGKPSICFRCGLGMVKTDQHDFVQMHDDACSKEKYIYICQDCKKQFKNKDLAMLHNKLEHEDYAKFGCNICEKELINQEKFIKHYKQCLIKQCLQTYTSNGADGITKLNEEMKKEKSDTSLIKASTNHHWYLNVNLQTIYHCIVCQTGFDQDQLEDFYYHLYTHCEEGTPPYICDRCGFGDVSEDGHDVTHTDDLTEPLIYSCEFEGCNLTFLKKQLLKQHKYSHLVEGNSGILLKCPFCKEEVEKLTDLLDHFKKHDVTGKGKPSRADKDETTKLTPNEENKRQNELSLLRSGYIGQLLHSNDVKNINLSSKSGPFNCFQCKGDFSDYGEFFVHLTGHNKHYQHICLSCGYGNSFNKEMQKFRSQMSHSELHKDYSSELLYSCLHCTDRFASEDLLTWHKREHANKGLFICKKCRLDFDSCVAYTAHTCGVEEKPTENRKATSDRDKDDKKEMGYLYRRPVKFSLTAAEFKQQILDRTKRQNINIAKNLIKTAKKNVLKGKTPSSPNHIYCKVCHLKLSYGYYMCEHSRSHVYHNASICNECGKIFRMPTGLKKHISRQHKAKNQICNLCGQGFGLALDLKSHIKKVHGFNKKVEKEDSSDHAYMQSKNQCVRIGGEVVKITGSETFSSYQAKDYVINTDEKGTYVCRKCGKVFKGIHRLNIYRHVQRVHFKDRFENCLVCNKRFAFKKDLKNHMNLCHGQRVQCKLCKKFLSCQRTLITHIANVHHSVKISMKYECTVCSKKFNTKKELVSHKETEHFVPEFDCMICQKKLGSRSGLQVHIDLMHGPDKMKGKKIGPIESEEVMSFIEQQLQEFPAGKKGEQKASSSDDEKPGPSGINMLHVCKHCGMRKRTAADLKEHVKTTHEQIQFNCNLCGAVCFDKTTADEHLENYHQNFKQANLACFTQVRKSPRIINSSDPSLPKIVSIASMSDSESSRNNSPARSRNASPKVLTIPLFEDIDGRLKVTRKLRLDNESDKGSDKEEETLKAARKYLSPVKRVTSGQWPSKPLMLKKDFSTDSNKSLKIVGKDIPLGYITSSPMKDMEKGISVVEDSNSNMTEDLNDTDKSGKKYSDGVTESDALLLHHFGSINRNLSETSDTLKETLLASNSIPEDQENLLQSMEALVQGDSNEPKVLDENKMVDDMNASLVGKEIIVEANVFLNTTDMTEQGEEEPNTEKIIFIEEVPENIKEENIISSNTGKTFKMSSPMKAKLESRQEKKKQRKMKKKPADDEDKTDEISDAGSVSSSEAPVETEKDDEDKTETDTKNTVHKVINVPNKLIPPYKTTIDLPDPREGVYNAVVNLPTDVKSVDLTVANMDNDDEHVYLLFIV